MPMRSFFFRLGAAAIGLMLLTSAYHRLNSSSLMAEAANRFLASLTPEQRAKATFAFEEDERQNWHFVPDRKSTRLNSSHLGISYAVFCLKKKQNQLDPTAPRRTPLRPPHPFTYLGIC